MLTAQRSTSPPRPSRAAGQQQVAMQQYAELGDSRWWRRRRRRRHAAQQMPSGSSSSSSSPSGSGSMSSKSMPSSGTTTFFYAHTKHAKARAAFSARTSLSSPTHAHSTNPFPVPSRIDWRRSTAAPALAHKPAGKSRRSAVCGSAGIYPIAPCCCCCCCVRTSSRVSCPVRQSATSFTPLSKISWFPVQTNTTQHNQQHNSPLMPLSLTPTYRFSH